MSAAVQHSTAQQRPSYTVSGFFRDERLIYAAMWACLHRGVPRDLMDVAVSPAAAPQFFGGRTRAGRDAWFSWAGRGALAGLLISAVFTLVLVLLPGFNSSPLMALVQFLGPDIGVIAGGVIGALYGWTRPTDVTPQLLRTADRTDAALMLVHLQPKEETEHIAELLKQHQAEDVRIEADSAKSVGSE